MRRIALLLAMAAALLPSLALAAGPEVLSLRDGVPKELLGKILGIAWGLFGLSLVLGLLVEAFRTDPTQTKNYAGVAWRAILVTALLSAYPKVFGTIITTTESIAERIAPQNIWDTFNQKNIESIQALGRDERASGKEHSSDWINGLAAGVFFDSFIVFFIEIAQAFQWAFVQLARILLALFYVLGPLALVFHIPAPSETASRWFKAFVTIATWSIFSSLLLALATALLFRTTDASLHQAYTQAFGAVASSVLLVLLNLAVPFLASAIVGGSVRNIIAPSLGAAAFGAVKTTAALTSAMQKLESFASGTSGPLGRLANSATDALRQTIAPDSPPSIALSSGLMPLQEQAGPPISVPTANQRMTHYDRPRASTESPEARGQPANVVAFGTPASFPRPPGLSTKDMTAPAAPNQLAAASSLPPHPQLPPEQTASVPTLQTPAESDSSRPPPPPPDAD